MDDTRLVTAKDCLHEAMVELSTDTPNIGRVNALLEDARCEIVDVVDGGLSSGASKADLNQLDSSRVFINRAISLLAKEWALTTAQGFIGHAIDYLQVVLSGNVISLSSRRRPISPGGGAA